jgi:hypothetical protein
MPIKSLEFWNFDFSGLINKELERFRVPKPIRKVPKIALNY